MAETEQISQYSQITNQYTKEEKYLSFIQTVMKHMIIIDFINYGDEILQRQIEFELTLTRKKHSFQAVRCYSMKQDMEDERYFYGHHFQAKSYIRSSGFHRLYK